MSNLVEIKLEFPIHSSVPILFRRIATATGLAEWFADDVRVNSEIYTFEWDGYPQDAKLISKEVDKSVVFEWIEEKTQFEFRIETDELTGDITLIVIDNVEEDEVSDSSGLWSTQIDQLKNLIGG